MRGKLHTRGAQKRTDYILYYKPNIPIAVIEAKDNNHTVGAGVQQALGYAETLEIPALFVYWTSFTKKSEIKGIFCSPMAIYKVKGIYGRTL